MISENRDMQDCKLWRSCYHFLVATQLLGGHGHSRTCIPQRGWEHLQGHDIFCCFHSFLHCSTSEAAFRRQGTGDDLKRLALLAKRINSPWQFHLLNSQHRNSSVFLRGTEFVWEGCTVQLAAEEVGQGWGGVLQEAEEALLALEELFATQRPTLSDFCRDWCFQHVETLWGKNILHVFSFQDFTILLAEQPHYFLHSFSRKFTFGQNRPEMTNLNPDFNCSQKASPHVPVTAAPVGASYALTPLWHWGKSSFCRKANAVPWRTPRTAR